MVCLINILSRSLWPHWEGLSIIWTRRPSWSCDLKHSDKFWSPCPMGTDFNSFNKFYYFMHSELLGHFRESDWFDKLAEAVPNGFYGYGSHIGHMISTIWTNIRSPIRRRLRKTGLSPPPHLIFYWPFKGGASVVVHIYLLIALCIVFCFVQASTVTTSLQ